MFKKEAFYANTTIPESIAQNIEENSELFHMVSAYTRDLTLRMVHYVYVTEDFEIVKTPATWWDMFKEAKFPDWLKAKYPPRYSERKIDKKILLVDGSKVDTEYKPMYSLQHHDRRPRHRPLHELFRG